MFAAYGHVQTLEVGLVVAQQCPVVVLLSEGIITDFDVVSDLKRQRARPPDKQITSYIRTSDICACDPLLAFASREHDECSLTYSVFSAKTNTSNKEVPRLPFGRGAGMPQRIRLKPQTQPFLTGRLLNW